MAQFIVMPKLGLTMTEGKICKWYKKEGDQVEKGDLLFSVETDKLTNDAEATRGGILRKILLEEGSIGVLKPVAIIGTADEDIEEMLSQAGAVVKEEKADTQVEIEEKVSEEKQAGAKRVKASPKARRLAKDLGVDLALIEGTGPGGTVSEKDVKDFSESGQVKVKSSPAAVKTAENLGVDINSIQQEGRVMKGDVIEYWNFEKLQEMAAPEEKRQEMSAMRRVISERMSESQKTAAFVNYNLSIDVRELKRFKDKLKPVVKVSYTDLIVKIVSRVLLEFPLVNSSIDDNEIITRNYVNMGVAVALDEGLIVPVVKYANVKGLAAISREIKELAGKARTNSLKPDEMSGGTFTVTNLGMFNMESFTPIINQPESAILGINSIRDVATNVDGELVFIPMMTLSLTADHRVVDGAVGARFLNRVKEYMENPSILVL
ncbi:pyruvate dehydrogenase E2 component (dihydrolipoamide acetyltransferase) [Dethiosulfatibacter aminovorans DSM 17477]|uniref:Dihydrolipoamide acetyltransferase component of pyruvate dehydrogenase complex n=1 Tax=Dethiosulfatibacter aminovorans DSM 17477 TaxID=1121476 RepID=A0A1M6F1P9_9FIRM|nr:dihydrolipoamide acetyltransferase family protein [Dethiosulfatibacter aminovorans]SHI91664.1 pyruvate dehydrogenase E2 component (dihydrolipoamide acetyltransferase) [Dethiosulfatibacter aminovorans DSM 17477]